MNTNNNSVEVWDLTKRFGHFTAVNSINFKVAKGEIFGFIGPNGAGKSTTIRMLCGILSPTSGTGSVGGFNIATQQNKIRQHIGYMSQKFSLYEDLTIDENIMFYGGIYGISKTKIQERRNWILRMADLENLAATLTKNLSIGWKQRLALGCAIIHEPEIVFLDEPTSGVDPIARKNFWRFIKDMAGRGVTVFVTTHYMDEAENCDRMALIYKGAIIAMGTPYELKNNAMKGDILKITLPESQDWIGPISHLPTVRKTSLFGTDIHAMVSDAESAESDITKLFEQEKTSAYSIKKIPPSLEDVFISLIEHYDEMEKQEL